MASSSGRVISLDLLRVVAALAVIMLHASAQHFVDGFPSAEWNVRLVYHAAVRWCVPVFLMISGALFLDPSRRLSLRHLYGKNLLRIVVAFFVWSYVYSFDKINAGPASKSLILLLTGPSHFWYIKMLVGLYIAVPLLRAITVDKTTERYFIVIALVTAIIIPSALAIAKQHGSPVVVKMLDKFYHSLYIDIAAGYSGYFVLGHFLYAYRPTQRQRRVFYILGIAAFVAMICGTHFYSHFTGKASNLMINYLTPTVLAESIAVFVLMTSHQWHLSAGWQRLVAQASRLSFGIYLVHVLVIRYSVSHGIDSSWLPAVYFVPLYTLGIFAVSCVMIWLLSKIPLANRYLM